MSVNFVSQSIATKHRNKSRDNTDDDVTYPDPPKSTIHNLYTAIHKAREGRKTAHYPRCDKGIGGIANQFTAKKPCSYS